MSQENLLVGKVEIVVEVLESSLMFLLAGRLTEQGFHWEPINDLPVLRDQPIFELALGLPLSLPELPGGNWHPNRGRSGSDRLKRV